MHTVCCTNEIAPHAPHLTLLCNVFYTPHGAQQSKMCSVKIPWKVSSFKKIYLKNPYFFLMMSWVKKNSLHIGIAQRTFKWFFILPFFKRVLYLGNIQEDGGVMGLAKMVERFESILPCFNFVRRRVWTKKILNVNILNKKINKKNG